MIPPWFKLYGCVYLLSVVNSEKSHMAQNLVHRNNDPSASRTQQERSPDRKTVLNIDSLTNSEGNTEGTLNGGNNTIFPNNIYLSNEIFPRELMGWSPIQNRQSSQVVSGGGRKPSETENFAPDQEPTVRCIGYSRLYA